MFEDFISNETLANKIEWVNLLENCIEVDCDDKKWSLFIEKA